jgi:SAM-dependent methyltransferase
MRWQVKGAIQKALSLTPVGHWLNERLQRSVGSLRRFDQEADEKLEDFALMAAQLREAGFPIAGTRFMEIGSGWYPTLPICLYLGGARRVVTVDLVRHLQPDLALALVRKLGGRLAWLADCVGAPAAEVEARRLRLERRLDGGASIGSASEDVIDYRAPADAARTDLLPHSIDVVFSNSVLEHIPRPVIDAIFTESWRVLRPGGICFHSVNCGDHYAYTDRSIGQLNYLKYSSRQWELMWNNEVQYQNRLRAVDFLDLARRHEFTIVHDTTRVLPERLAELRRLPRVAPEFHRYSEEELCVTTVDFIGRKDV